MTDLLILGAGTAGLTAAIYACRAGLSAIVLEQGTIGGQITNSPEVENYPTLPKVSGFDFSNTLYEQAKSFGAQVVFDTLRSVSLDAPVKIAETETGTFEARCVIIANGAKRRLLGCEGEDEFSGRGVSYCATCDGMFFRGKTVAVVGGGNTALEDALFLANICEKVLLIHRRDKFRGSAALSAAVAQRPNIEIHFDSAVERITGGERVEGIVLRSLRTTLTCPVAVDGVFIAVGMAPDNSLFAGQVDLDPAGYIVADETCRTNLPGVFAAGDTRTKLLRQLVTAAADGAVAAYGAAGLLSAGGGF